MAPHRAIPAGDVHRGDRWVCPLCHHPTGRPWRSAAAVAGDVREAQRWWGAAHASDGAADRDADRDGPPATIPDAVDLLSCDGCASLWRVTRLAPRSVPSIVRDERPSGAVDETADARMVPPGSEAARADLLGIERATDLEHLAEGWARHLDGGDRLVLRVPNVDLVRLAVLHQPLRRVAARHHLLGAPFVHCPSLAGLRHLLARHGLRVTAVRAAATPGTEHPTRGAAWHVAHTLVGTEVRPWLAVTVARDTEPATASRARSRSAAPGRRAA